MGTLLTWSKVTSVISLSQGLIFHIGPLLGDSSKLTLMMCPLLAGLWTTLVLEKNTVYYISHSKYLFYKPAHAFFLAFDPTLALCPLNIHFPLIFSLSPRQKTQMTASETHTSVDPDVQFCSIVQEVTYKANSAYVVSLKSFGFL